MPIEVHALEPQIRLILCSPGTDLTTISAKRVRKQLLDVEPSLTAKYLKENRKELDTVIARVFEAVANGQGIEDSGQGEEQTSPSKKHRKRKSREDGVSADGGVAGDDDDRYEEDEDEEDESGSQARTSSPKKLKKGVKGRGTVLSDAELARRLSSEINSRSSRRSAGRPAGSNGSTPRKGGKKKSAAVVDSDDGDDSEGYASGKKQAKVKRKAGGAAKGGFAKEYTLRWVTLGFPVLLFLPSRLVISLPFFSPVR
jgi:upstream activation factor subunit UAF30